MHAKTSQWQILKNLLEINTLPLIKMPLSINDYLSAFQDSIEGSDADAALYYLAVILKSGDLESVVKTSLRT